MTGEYLGVDPQTLQALGRVVVAAGRLESVAHDIAAALGQDARKLNFAPTLKAISRATQVWIPPWATCTASDVREWRDKAFAIMDARDKRLHSVFSKRWDGAAWQPIQAHTKTGSVEAIDVSTFDAVAGEILAHSEAGYALLRGLTPEMQPGVNVRVFLSSNEARIMINTDIVTPPVPSNEVIDEWYQQVIQPQVDQIEFVAVSLAEREDRP